MKSLKMLSLLLTRIITSDRDELKHRIDNLDQVEDKLTHSHQFVYQNVQYLHDAFFAIKAQYNNGRF